MFQWQIQLQFENEFGVEEENGTDRCFDFVRVVADKQTWQTINTTEEWLLCGGLSSNTSSPTYPYSNHTCSFADWMNVLYTYIQYIQYINVQYTYNTRTVHAVYEQCVKAHAS